MKFTGHVQYVRLTHVGTWQNRHESVNLLQKHDVELIKDAKRCTYTLVLNVVLRTPTNTIHAGLRLRVRSESKWMN